jgi:hypothetical protein
MRGSGFAFMVYTSCFRRHLDFHSSDQFRAFCRALSADGHAARFAPELAQSEGNSGRRAVLDTHHCRVDLYKSAEPLQSPGTHARWQELGSWNRRDRPANFMAHFTERKQPSVLGKQANFCTFEALTLARHATECLFHLGLWFEGVNSVRRRLDPRSSEATRAALASWNRSPIIVLGMHKSGTTLVARLLSDAGVDMGTFDMTRDYDIGNALERYETQKLNRRLLRWDKRHSLDILRPLDMRAVGAPELERGREIVARMESANTVWGFKDPRTCLTYNYWRTVLPTHRVIVVYRDPEEVAAHYLRRSRRHEAPFIAFAALRCWAAYNVHILSALGDRDDALILNYSVLMQDGTELARLGNFLGCKVLDSRESKRYRARKIHGALYKTALALVWLLTGRNVEATHRDLTHRWQRQREYGGEPET